MEPFDQYPDGGQQLIARLRGGNCRHEYGLALQHVTGQTACAFCAVSLIDTYEHWLLMSVDHVVPTRAGEALGIPAEWLGDICNCVLCCSACNGFGNRYRLPQDTAPPGSLPDFVRLRDETFSRRKELILESQERERRFFSGRPWESGGTASRGAPRSAETHDRSVSSLTSGSDVSAFVDDDEGYLKWLGANPHGFVVNCGRVPSPDYLVLHKATCGTIRGRPARGETWTGGDFAKICAENVEQLDRWAVDQVGAAPEACGLCRP